MTGIYVKCQLSTDVLRNSNYWEYSCHYLNLSVNKYAFRWQSVFRNALLLSCSGTLAFLHQMGFVPGGECCPFCLFPFGKVIPAAGWWRPHLLHRDCLNHQHFMERFSMWKHHPGDVPASWVSCINCWSSSPQGKSLCWDPAARLWEQGTESWKLST